MIDKNPSVEVNPSLKNHVTIGRIERALYHLTSMTEILAGDMQDTLVLIGASREIDERDQMSLKRVGNSLIRLSRICEATDEAIAKALENVSGMSDSPQSELSAAPHQPDTISTPMNTPPVDRADPAASVEPPRATDQTPDRRAAAGSESAIGHDSEKTKQEAGNEKAGNAVHLGSIVTVRFLDDEEDNQQTFQVIDRHTKLTPKDGIKPLYIDLPLFTVLKGAQVGDILHYATAKGVSVQLQVIDVK